MLRWAPVTVTWLAAIVPDCGAHGEASCSFPVGENGTEVTSSLLLQRGQQVRSVDKIVTEQEGESLLSLSSGEFLIRPVTIVPSSPGWKGCQKFGCNKWQEFVACGVSEQEVYDALVQGGVNAKRVVLGDRMQGGPKIPIRQRTGNKKRAAYAPVSPMPCSAGGSKTVHFLVNKAGNIGSTATENTIKAMHGLKLREPFTCDMEHWFRQRMSESMEAEPNPYLLGSFPEFQDFAASSPEIASLLQRGAELEAQLAQAQEQREEAEESGGAAKDVALLQSAEETLITSLAEVEQRIDSARKGLKSKFLSIHQKFGHSHGIALGARFIRMIFHDAADYKNLINGRGERICGPNRTCGGVDFRLHTALLSVGLNQQSLPQDDETDELDGGDDDDETQTLGDPNHNRGLTNAFRWLHAWKGHQSVLGGADLAVLGAHVAMETWFSGPEMDYVAGRVDAVDKSNLPHEAEYCTHEDCLRDQKGLFLASPVAEPVGDGMFCPFGNTATELAGMLNLSQKELVALQGSHSIGGIIRCSGMGNTAQGSFCGGAKCCPPGMEDRGGKCECTMPDCRSLAVGLNGATFDGTPNKLDNMYYKQLDRADFTELPDCSDVTDLMPTLRSGDQNIFICMKKKGFKWTPTNVGSNGSSWEAAEKAGCTSSIKGAYSNRNLEAKCRQRWGPGGKGIGYPKRSWCSVDKCMEKCQEHDCPDTALAEVAVLMGKFQNKDYGKTCDSYVHTTDPGLVQSILDAIPKNAYMDTTIRSDLTLQDQDGADFQAKGLRITHCGTLKDSRSKIARMKCKMKSYLEGILAKIPLAPGGQLTKPIRMYFADPDDPYCNQCTVPACEADATAALQNALCGASCFKPDNVTHVQWVADIMKTCKDCKDACLKQDEAQNGLAGNRQPEWCLKKSSTGFCARGGKHHDCPGEHRYLIPNHGDGRRSMIFNTLRWTRFRGQTRRIMLLPSDWSYLGNDTHRSFIREFAQDNDLFLKMWKQAFQKVSRLGMHGAPQTCRPVACAVAPDGKSIVCTAAINPGMGADDLVFDRCAPAKDGPMGEPSLAAGSSCSLKRNFGVRAVFACGGQEMYCTTQRGRDNEQVAKKELSYGQDESKCWDDYQDTSLTETGMREDDQ